MSKKTYNKKSVLVPGEQELTNIREYSNVEGLRILAVQLFSTLKIVNEMVHVAPDLEALKEMVSTVAENRHEYLFESEEGVFVKPEVREYARALGIHMVK